MSIDMNTRGVPQESLPRKTKNLPRQEPILDSQSSVNEIDATSFISNLPFRKRDRKAYLKVDVSELANQVTIE